MTFYRQGCKPSGERFAKCLKTGADCRSRTDDLLITKKSAFVKAGFFAVNRRPDAPLRSMTWRWAVNRRAGVDLAEYEAEAERIIEGEK